MNPPVKEMDLQPYPLSSKTPVEINQKISEDDLPDYLRAPVWWDPQHEWYAGYHKTWWTRQLRWTVIWVIFMCIIVGLYYLRVWEDAATLYSATFLCWLVNCLIGNTSFTATCFVATGLSLWKAWERFRDFMIN